MYNANVGNALQQYRKVNVASEVDDATPHRLIQMLLDGALARIAAARGHLQRGEVAAKGEAVGMAISIIGGLKGSLDLNSGGELAKNLDALYDYMAQRMMEGNKDNDAAAFDEVHDLLAEIKAGWDAIPESQRNGQVQALRPGGNS